MTTQSLMSYIIVAAVSALVGAFVLDRYARIKHGSGYAERIKRDFDLQWRLMRDIVIAHHDSPFSAFIQKLSPQFCLVYGEAAAAESAPLTQLAGLGYGKALELLIKDFAKHENPGNAAAIESAALGTCVKNYLNDDLLKNSAELGVWLRNDQVHYIRKFEEQGVKELKFLIHLVVRLIEESDRRKRFSGEVNELRQRMTSPRSPGAKTAG
jgi:hypothetical protein